MTNQSQEVGSLVMITAAAMSQGIIHGIKLARAVARISTIEFRIQALLISGSEERLAKRFKSFLIRGLRTPTYDPAKQSRCLIVHGWFDDFVFIADELVKTEEPT